MQSYALELRSKSFYEDTLYIIGTISIKYSSLIIAPTIGFVVVRGGLFPIVSTKGVNQIKKEKVEEKVKFNKKI